jgi:hypothetical protein
MLLDDSAQALTDSSKLTLSASARIEFQASLQLLVERASFLTASTGVAIALPEADVLVYCAAAGCGVSEAGSAVDLTDPNVRDCMRNARALHVPAEGKFKLLVPIVAGEKAVGFFELISTYNWTEQDVATVTHLADMASVALEHRAAAETADAHAWQELQEQPLPTMWHAPQQPGTRRAAEPETESKGIPDVKTCAACGFPVSPGRNLCVECEQKSDTPVVAPAELFSMQNQESWMSEHGYTVASLVVSALAAAVIYYLRR